MAVNVLPTAVPLGIPQHMDMPFEQNLFDDLVHLLKETLGPSSGLTSDDINVNFLARLMKLYDSRDRNWAKYAFGDKSRGYTRNLVDEGNGKSNLVSTSTPMFSASIKPWVSPLMWTCDSSCLYGLQAREARFTTTATPTV